MLKIVVFDQVKATAENVDEAVRELPDANLVRYSSFLSILLVNNKYVIILKMTRENITYQNDKIFINLPCHLFWG